MSDKYLDHLLAERDRAVGEERSIIDAAMEGSREPSAEERATLGRIDEAIARFDTEIAARKARLVSDREADEARSLNDQINVLRPDVAHVAEQRNAAEVNALDAFLRGDTRSIEIDLRPAANELAMIRAGADYRALGRDTAAAGGTLIPTTFARTLIMAMETIGGPVEAGSEILTTSSGENFTYFKEATAGTAAAVGEGTALAGSDPTFGQVTLSAWKFGELVAVSNELISDSGIDIIGYVAQTAGKALGRVTNTAFTTGTGTNAPQGFVTGSLLGGTGVISQTTATGVPSYSDIVDLLYSVSDEAYAGSRSVFMTKFANLAALRKVKDGAGNYIWTPSLAAGQPSTLLGYNIVTNPAMHAWSTAASQRTMAFGDFNEGYVIRRVGTVRFERSDDLYFDKDQVAFRAVIRTDAKTKVSGAVKVMQAPTT